MVSEQPIENLTPLGYLIVSATPPTVPDTNKLYYGVVRTPSFCPTHPKIRAFFGEPLEEDPVMARAIDEWYELNDEPYFTRITPDYDHAVRLMRILGRRVPLELLFCELAWSPGEEGRISAYREFVGQPKNVTLTYGYDASWRECNYSAILHVETRRQVTPDSWVPLVPDAPYWKTRLNEWGLLSSYGEIRALRERFAQAYPDVPAGGFDIFRVHHVEPD